RKKMSLGHPCASSYQLSTLGHGFNAVSVRLRELSFSRHSHDCYVIVVTTEGIQEFYYRGTIYRSIPGQVVVLHPGEVHDGKPGTGHAFGFTGLHLDAAVVLEHMRTLSSRDRALPFLPDPVAMNPALARLAKL